MGESRSLIKCISRKLSQRHLLVTLVLLLGCIVLVTVTVGVRRSAGGVLSPGAAWEAKPNSASSPVVERADPEGINHNGDAHLLPPSRCPVRGKTFEPLTEFQFWGRTMNVSSPCPTAGMSNQLVMLFGLLHCAQRQQGEVFKFKDITCSPTGGKDNRRGYRVGSDDYEYVWFRWSEIYRIRRPPTASAVALGSPELCLADEHSWSEHPWMKGCPTTVDHIYGQPAYWHVRAYFQLQQWYEQVALDFLSSHDLRPFHRPRQEGGRGRGWVAGQKTSSLRPDPETLHSDDQRGLFIAIHVRRGDYENFCRQTSKSSGVRKFLTAPFRWLRHNSTMLSHRFMHACYPSTAMVAEHVRKVIAVIEEKRRLRVSTTPKSSASDGGNVTHVFVASNSPAFVDELRQTMKPRSAGVQSVKIITLSEYFANAADEAAVRQAYWPEQARRPGGIGGTFTTTERAVLDITVMSMAEGMVLNKYSTFSQSAIDVRVQRHMMDEERSGGATVLRFDAENDPTVFWW